MDKIILGTAQFGLDYGVSNKHGKTGPLEVSEILKLGNKLGIQELDTAPSYGDSEQILARNFSDDFLVNSKLIPCGRIQDVISRLDESIQLFGKNINTIYIHDILDLNKSSYVEVLNRLYELKEKGIIKRIGVSVYDEKGLDLVSKYLNPDVIQVPFNIYDNRFMNSSNISSLTDTGCKIHIRSVFLQGLMLIPPNELPVKFNNIVDKQTALYEYAYKCGYSIYYMCLLWVLSQEWAEKIIVGINNLDQLKELSEAVNKIEAEENNKVSFERFSIDDLMVINPVNW